MTIQVKIRQVYGRDTIYPACERSELFAKLANQKTLTNKEIQIIKALGFTIQVIQDAVTL